jgi:hypothetical protein
VQEAAQTCEPLAGGGLRQLERFRGTADAAAAQHRVEQAQQVEVDVLEMHLAYIGQSVHFID